MIKRLILPARYLTLSLAMLLAGVWLGKQSDEQPTFMSVASDAVGPSENVRQIPTPSENVGLVVRNIPTLNESYAINRGFYTTEDISQFITEHLEIQKLVQSGNLNELHKKAREYLVEKNVNKAWKVLLAKL